MAYYIIIMSYELTGKLVAKFDTVQRTETFKTRGICRGKNGRDKWPYITNYIKFQCVQDKTTIVDKVNIGDNIKCTSILKAASGKKDGKTNYITNRMHGVLNKYCNRAAALETDNEFIEPLDTFRLHLQMQ